MTQRRSAWPVVAHVVLALLTVLALAGVWYLGASVWQLVAAAGAAVLLHVGAVVALRRPWVGYAVGALAMLVLVTMPFQGWTPTMLPSAACFPLTLWRLTMRVSLRSSVGALVVAALGIVLTELVAWERQPADVAVWTRLIEGGLLLLVMAGVWLGALLVRGRHEAGRRAEGERLAAAVAEERASIRRDLHDVIAHTVTVMVARIEAAAVTTSDRATRRELGDIAEAGRDAHQGLRAMLATLGPRADARPLSLEVLPELVASAASPLHVVTMAEVGERRALSLSAEVAVVRTVQEGITNALRHLEPPVGVAVVLRWGAGEVVVEVRDDGGSGRRGGGGLGTGLLGIEERVRTAGGTLVVEGGDGGWVLLARLPTKEGA
ncbi:sensor histidine kinase [Nonomuraea sp. NPDC050556]|uniref:sensor histidine kinase n=1 Tax=Nonomuraea sp. NPDC050556 TaxID=3364369 RepID=UPI0037B19D23